ncbi:hypothetical protein AB9P05_10170 [Roseivirga sp. BDSF3-8]|uniref:hypothetical protein n=1 Tax=Roseivirga sp. BDSF3-8 TaxID=3241598 RepID=UPI003531E2C4
MSTGVLFWNVHRKELGREIATICEEKGIGILCLAECPNPNNLHESWLNGYKRIETLYEINQNLCIFYKLSDLELEQKEEHPKQRVVLLNLNRVRNENILVAFLHLNSKLWKRESDLRLTAGIVKRWLDQREKIYGGKLMVVGDFNMNPFDPGMIAPDGFNAVLHSQVAKKRVRKISTEYYSYFYNPMWSYLGDRNYQDGSAKVAGSYYYSRSTDSNCVFWNMFDKVILRPELTDDFNFESLDYITHINGDNLLRNGRPHKSKYSDHLPLYFRI